ncbi:isoprenylcysteine carboxylmethyltransferase family protein [Ralstonia solanacearum]|nr:isoprenylcysteine carboxylmethyltransferase family protein [Ralstonia solanacearum]
MRRSVAAAVSLVFFAIAPGVVAGLVPWWLTHWRVLRPLPEFVVVRGLGVVLLFGGTVALIAAFTRFVTEGAGTPAPVAPPERLVVGGLYRHVRNPMYLAVEATIVGQALLLWQPALLLYAAAVWATMALFVRTYEEPALRRKFGAQYEAYRDAVPAWWPRLRPWKRGGDRK